MPVDYMTKSDYHLTAKPLFDKLDELIAGNKELKKIIVGNGKLGLTGKVILNQDKISSIDKFVESQIALNEQLVKVTVANKTRNKIAVGVLVTALLLMIAQMVFKF